MPDMPDEFAVPDGVGDLMPGLASLAAEPAPVGEALLPVEAEPMAPVEPMLLLAVPEPFIVVPLAPTFAEPLVPAAPFGTRLPCVESPWPEVDELPVLAAGLPGFTLRDELVVEAVLPELMVVESVLGDFLLLFMSPRASAEPLARATNDVRMNAGASLRIWASKV